MKTLLIDVSNFYTKTFLPSCFFYFTQYAAREAETVAQAGRKYAITISTNMAGRGTDIILGGNPKVHELISFLVSLGNYLPLYGDK